MVEQADRVEQDPWVEQIERMLANVDDVCVAQVTSMLSIPLERQDLRTQNRIVLCLKQLGFRRNKLVSAGSFRGRARWSRAGD